MEYINEEEIRKSLSLLKQPGEIFEIRIVGSAKKIYSGYFKDVDLMIEQLRTLDLKKTNVYFTINAVDEACYDRSQRDQFQTYTKSTTSDSDIISYNYIMIDVDPVRPSDTSSTDEQIQKAKDLANKIYGFLRDLGFEKPAFGFSGNGCHLLYKVALVRCDDNKNLVKRALETLAMLFDTDEVKVDTTTFNPARVCKLYGTLAQKGSGKGQRPYRMSYLYGHQQELQQTDIEYIKKLNSYYPQELDKPQRYNNYNPKDFDIEQWLNKYNIGYRKMSFTGGEKYVLDECPFDSNHKAPDSAIFKMANGALGFKCFHNSCDGRSWHDVRIKFEPEAYEKNYEQEQRIKYHTFNRDTPPQKKHIEEKKNEPIFQTALQIRERKEPPKIYIKSSLEEYDNKTGGFIKGQVTLVSGVRASAKSTWLNQVMLSAIDAGNRVGCFSGELKDTRFMSWLYRQAAGKAYVKANTNFENSYYVEDKIQQKIAEWLSDNFFLYNNRYGTNFGAMLEQFEKLVKDKMIDLLVLDNLMAFDTKELAENKYDQQTQFVLSLHRMAEEYNIHIIFVAHPRKSYGFLRLDDVSGSADLANAVDNALIVHRNNTDFQVKTKQLFGWHDDEPVYQATNVIEVCKERENGLQDFFIPLWYEPETKRLRNSFTENIIYGWNKDKDGFYNVDNISEETPFEDATEETPFDIEDNSQLSLAFN